MCMRLADILRLNMHSQDAGSHAYTPSQSPDLHSIMATIYEKRSKHGQPGSMSPMSTSRQLGGSRGRAALAPSSGSQALAATHGAALPRKTIAKWLHTAKPRVAENKEVHKRWFAASTRFLRSPKSSPKQDTRPGTHVCGRRMLRAFTHVCGRRVLRRQTRWSEHVRRLLA
jgi:hypothetical protein